MSQAISSRRNFAVTLIWFSLLVALFYWSTALSLPYVESVTLTYPDEQPQPARFPIRLRDGETQGHVRVVFEYSRWQSRHWNLLVDDCLQQVTINGAPVADFVERRCDYAKYSELNLSGLAVPGRNTIEFDAINTGGAGSVSIEPSRTRGPLLFALLAISALTIALGTRVFKIESKAALALTLLGVALRIIYFAYTPFDYRTHDYGGHLDYLYYIVDYLRLPAAKACWGCYGPPLYYAVWGGWIKLTLGSTHHSLTPYLAAQVGSLVCSVLSVNVMIAIGGLIADKIERPDRMPFYAGIAAMLPGVILLTPRVNNDVLLLLLGSIGLWCASRWWLTRSNRFLDGAAVSFGLAVLTKSTAVVYIAYLLALAALRHRTAVPKALRSLSRIALISLLVAAPALVGRKLVSDSQIFNPLPRLDSALNLENSTECLLTFQPDKMIEIVYNHPFDDQYRRKYYLEFLYRSAFFGEFIFDDQQKLAARCLLWSGIVLLAFLVIGILAARKSRDQLFIPLGLWGLALFSSTALFRILEPVVPAQDFRYVPLLTVPAAYFAAHSLSGPRRSVRAAQWAVWLIFVAASCWFFVQTSPRY